MSQKDSSDLYCFCFEDIHDVRDYLSISTPSFFKVKTYDSELKKVYIYKVHEDDSITGLVHEFINEPQEIDNYYNRKKSGC